MAQCTQHKGQDHEHGPDCEHAAVQHQDHVDYLHDGCLHNPHDAHVDEHTIKVDKVHPAGITPQHDCGAHSPAHEDGPDCGHPAVPHGDHEDYLVEGHLHHPHMDHCDRHGEMKLV